MPVKLKPTSEIIVQLGLNPNGKTQRFLQETCYKKMDKYVPLRDGDLRTVVDLSDPQYIVYEMPYAEYQYYGVRKDGTRAVKNYTTPGTGTYWDKRMVSAEIQDVIKEVETYMKRGGK